MKIAIVCAGGSFPIALAEKLAFEKIPFFLILLKNLTAPQLQSYEHVTVKLSHVAAMIENAKTANCDKICFVGSITRPNPFALLPDLKTLFMMPQLLKAFKGGDNHLLTSLANLFEKNGLKLVGAHEIAPQLLAPKGVWGKITPNEQDMQDCDYGFMAAKAFGIYDVGQAIIISNSHIVAVEGIEGTDGMLERVKLYRDKGRLKWQGKRGILLKAIKPNQDERLDMPAIGVDTIKNAAKAELRGVIVETGRTLVMDIEAVTREADKLGLFVMGV